MPREETTIFPVPHDFHPKCLDVLCFPSWPLNFFAAFSWALSICRPDTTARAASSRGASSAPADIALVAGLRKNSAASSNAGSSSLDTAVYAADAAFACESCGQPFEADLVARHRCAWCGDAVCRKCLHTQVRSAGSEPVGRKGLVC